MLRVTASLPRDATFFAGEPFTCTLTFTNTNASGSKFDNTANVFVSEIAGSVGDERGSSSLSTPRQSRVSQQQKHVQKQPSIHKQLSQTNLNGIDTPNNTSTSIASSIIASILSPTRLFTTPTPTQTEASEVSVTDGADADTNGDALVDEQVNGIHSDNHTDTPVHTNHPPPISIPHINIHQKHPQNTIEIAWAFAQLTGHFEYDPQHVNSSLLESINDTVMYAAAGTRSVGGSTTGASASTFGSGNTKDSGKTMPTLSMPPSILFYDVSIPPGESRSYRYEMVLPCTLPPSHAGKHVRFKYRMSIGVYPTSQTTTTTTTTTTNAQDGKVFSVPFRVGNRTFRDGTRFVYDVLRPVVVTTDMACITDMDKYEKHGKASAVCTPGHGVAGIAGLGSGFDDDDVESSLDNVLGFCQAAKKGETIQAILTFTASTTPCMSVSLSLESTEHIDPPYGLKPRHVVTESSRKVYAVYKRACINARRVVVGIDVPWFVNPGFSTSLVTLKYVLRVSFMTVVSVSGRDGGNSLYKHDPITPNSADATTNAVSITSGTGIDGFRSIEGNEKVDVEVFDCAVPIKVYPGFKYVRKGDRKYIFDV